MLWVKCISVFAERLVAVAATVGTDVWLIGGWDPGMKQDGGSILVSIPVGSARRGSQRRSLPRAAGTG